jgi:4-hydroxy-3-methylbut-2-enyl diphosphate reductase IspH
MKAIARQTRDGVLVVSYAHSHNSAMLARVAREHGAGAAYPVDGLEDIGSQWLTGRHCRTHRRRLGAS